MRSLQNFLLLTALASVFGMSPWSDAEPVRVRHVEGVTFGFLVLKDMDGKTLAHGELKQVVKPDDPVVMADLRFQFKDGSLYREITKFTQRGVFRLVSDQVVETGPSFKMDSESWVDARTGKITVRTVEKGKKKAVTKKTKTFFLESPTNPTLEVIDIGEDDLAPSGYGAATVFSSPRVAWAVGERPTDGRRVLIWSDDFGESWQWKRPVG